MGRSYCSENFFRSGDSRHSAIFVHDFADYGGSAQSCNSTEVYGAFRMPARNQHNHLPGSKRKIWPGDTISSAPLVGSVLREWLGAVGLRICRWRYLHGLQWITVKAVLRGERFTELHHRELQIRSTRFPFKARHTRPRAFLMMKLMFSAVRTRQPIRGRLHSRDLHRPTRIIM